LKQDDSHHLENTEDLHNIWQYDNSDSVGMYSKNSGQSVRLKSVLTSGWNIAVRSGVEIQGMTGRIRSAYQRIGI